jgi:hypothetical protein
VLTFIAFAPAVDVPFPRKIYTIWEFFIVVKLCIMFIRWLMLIMPCKPDGYECGPYLQDETGQKRTRKKKRTARDSKKEQGRKRKEKEGQGRTRKQIFCHQT